MLDNKKEKSNQNQSEKSIHKDNISNEYYQDNKENYYINNLYTNTGYSQNSINPINKIKNNLNDESDNYKIRDLFTAVEYNDLVKVKEILKENPSQINELNEEGLSLLHISVIKSNLKMINLLLSYGADSNILNKNNQTPLHLAYINQNSMSEEIIKQLLNNNARDSILDLNNKRPSDYMCSSYTKNQKYNINNINGNADIENSDKNKYINNNTGNTGSLVTIDNHSDSSFTTNKEDEKSNQNNNNSNNKTVIQSPYKIDIDYDYNEIISINNSVIKQNNNMVDKMNNNNIEKLDINNDYYFNFIKENENNNNIINEEYLNNHQKEKIELNDSLEENIKDKENDEILQSNDLFQTNNKKLENKDNNNQNSINLYNNSMLTYTDSCFQSKNKLSNQKLNSENNKNDDDNSILKSPFDLEESQKKEEISDILLKTIITKKRNSYADKKNKTNNSFNNNSCMNKRNYFLDFEENNNTIDYSLKNNKNNYISPLSINNLTQIEKKNKHLNKNTSRTSYNGKKTRNKYIGNMSQYSTYTQSHKINNNLFNEDINKIKNNNNNNKITEFHYIDSNNNNSFNTLNSIYSNNENSDNNYRNISLLKYWLSNIGLSEYLENFTNNSIYDIDKLIEKMKNNQTKLNFDGIERLLKIRTPGYIYRILCKLEADAGLIDPKIVKFLIRDGNNEPKNFLIKNINSNDLKISVSESYYTCLNCCKMNQIKKYKKNDLKYFLTRYELLHLYQHFNHNGFDLIEFVLLQMYSSSPINEDILENDFHIYDEKQRSSTLKAIVSEMKIINDFLNSDEYNDSLDKKIIKYDNIIFENDDNKCSEKILFKNNKNEDSGCYII